MRLRIAMALLSMFAAVTAAAESPSFPAVTPKPQDAEWAQSWWMPRHEAKLKEKEAAGEVDLLFIGDSITQAWEDGGKAVWEEYYSDRNAFNLGFSGDRTEQVLWRLQHGAVDGLSPELVVLMIGTNNTGHRQDPAEQTAAGIERIVDLLHEKLPETHILLLGVFPRGERPEDPLRKLNQEINSRIESLGEREYVTYKDIGQEFLQEDGRIAAETMPDFLHLTPESYKTWAAAIEPLVAEHLPRK